MFSVDRTLVLTCQVMRQAVKGFYDNCHYMMFSNKISLIIELTIHQLSVCCCVLQITLFQFCLVPF